MRSMESSGSLLNALERAAEQVPERGLVIFNTRGRRPRRRRYGDLLTSVKTAAARLHAIGVEPGSRVLVCLPTSWAWIESWLGALYLGALPVAVAPGPLLGSNEEHLDRLRGISELLAARHLVCSSRLAGDARDSGIFASDLVVTSPQQLVDLPTETAPRRAPDRRGARAFLQLTSGTTDRPRAVEISHRAAVHNALAIGRAVTEPHRIEAGAPDHAVVSWLPLHHDMGLVGCLLAGIVHGLETVLLPPEAFLGRPRLWLEQLGRGLTCASAAPNFGYRYCAETVRRGEVEGVDLSRWKAAMVGAETVQPETLSEFADRFAELGFDGRSFRPCYGLAEATLAVTIDLAGEGPRLQRPPAGYPGSHQPVVCLGRPIADTEVVAAAADGSSLAEGQVGEIRVRGPGLLSGYFGDRPATDQAFEDGWLCTGDLGFLCEGELYLIGRLKEVLILGGRNYMPGELERVAEQAIDGRGLCRAGAFSVSRDASGEQVVLVAESPVSSPDGLRQLAEQIRHRIGLRLGLPIAEVAFVPEGRIPKTSSGKVRRRQLKSDYLAAQLPTMSYR